MSDHDDSYDDDDDETPAPPRTMRRPRPAPVEDDADDEATSAPPRRPRRPAPPADDADDDTSDDDGDDDTPGSTPQIRGGWTEGQKTMDSASNFAQALKPEADIQVIRFLDDVPYANYRRHWIERANAQGGTSKRPYTCLETIGKICPLCDAGDSPQAVSAFNVALLGDDGQVILKSWDVGVRIFNTLKTFNSNPKQGPLTKNYYAVNKTGRGGNTQTNVVVVKERDLEEDYGLQPPTAEELRQVGKYDSSIIQIPKKSDLQEIADEMADYDD